MKRSLLSGLLITTMLLSACNSSVSTSGQTDNSVNGSAASSITESTTETNETTEEPKMYDIMWGDTASKLFSDYLLSKVGMDLATYVHYFGFTDNLNILYSEYMEINYGTEGRVSFLTSNYFFSYLDTCDAEGKRRYRNYDIFAARYFDSEICFNGTFNNKLIMSYLCQNNLKLGYMIPEVNYKSISTDYLNICKEFDIDYYINNSSLGTFGNNHVYTLEETLASMVIYNNNMCYIYFSESMKDFDIMSKPEAVEAFNQNLKTYYGPNAPQIGQVVTVEQYRAMFGEDPLDLSYIPGAVVNQRAS